MDAFKRYAGNVGLAGGTNVIVTLKGFILIPILTKGLGAEFYGIYALIVVTISLLAPLCTLGLGYAIVRFLGPEKDREKVSKGVSSIFVVTSSIALAVSILLFAFSRPLSTAFFGGVDATFYIKIAAFLVFLTAFEQIMANYFRAFQQMKKYAIFTISSVIGQIALTAYLVLVADWGLSGVFVSILVIMALVSLLGFFWIKSDIKISTPSFSIIKDYLPLALPILPISLCYWFINLGDRYVIGYFMGADAVGVYSAAYGLGGVVAFFYAPIATALLPAITGLYEDNRIQEVKTHLKYSLKFFLMFAIPSVFGLSVLSRSLLETLTTSEFIGGYTIVPIIALATVLFSCGNIYGNVLFLLKRTRMMSLIYVGLALLNVALNIILVLFIGIIGAAIATLITFMTQLVVASRMSSKGLRFDVDFRFIVKSVISSAVMAIVAWQLNPAGLVNILISVIIAVVVYFGVLILLRGFTRREYGALRDIVKGVR